jgi:hypothetical protein
MKRTVLFFAAVVLAAFVFAGCASPPAAQAPAAQPASQDESNMTVEANRSRILDWQNRNLRLPSNPEWLVRLADGDDYTFKDQFNIDDLGTDAVIKLVPVTGASLPTVQAQGLTQLAAILSTEIRTNINMETATSLSNDQQTTTQDILMTAKFSVSGMRQVTTFWQQVETENSAGRRTRQYIYYVVYATGRANWNGLVKAYMNSVLSELMKDPSNRQLATTLARLTDEVAADSAELKAWNKDEIAYQRQVAEEKRQDDNTARDQQYNRDMQADRLALAAQRETEASSRNATNAAAGTERTAIAPERQTAIQASVSGDDINWVDALSLGADILL